MVERARRTAALNCATVAASACGIERERDRELADGCRLDGREHRRHELAHRLRVDDRIARSGPAGRRPAGPRSRSAWARSLRPRRRSAAPRLLTTMPSETQSTRVQMPPSNLRRARIDRHRMSLRRIADRLGAVVEQHAQHASHVVAACRGSGSCRRSGPHASRSQARFDSKPPAAATTQRARTSRLTPSRTTTADSKRPPAMLRSVISRVVLDLDAQSPRRRDSRRSSAPCRRRGRRHWCATRARCRRATAGSARRDAASTSRHVAV